MADPLSIAASALSIVELGFKIIAKTIETAQPGFRRTGSSLTWAINCWSDEEVKSWKASYIANCNSIAVASAIFASIGLGSLQLPDMNATHWTARAFLMTSMALGILSTVYATAQQAEVAMLIEPLDLRIYLSRGRNEWRAFMGKAAKLSHVGKPDFSKLAAAQTKEKKHSDPESVPDISTTRTEAVRNPTDSTTVRSIPYIEKSDMAKLLPIQGSVAMEVRALLPQELLYLAVWAYMIGFGLYLLFLWLRNVGGDGQNHKNIFIFFVVIVAVFLARILSMSLIQVLDGARRNLDFDEQKAETSKNRALLDQWLTKLKELKYANENPLEAAREAEVILAEIVEIVDQWKGGAARKYWLTGIDVVTDMYLLSMLRSPEFLLNRLRHAADHD